MHEAERYPFTAVDSGLTEASFRPQLPVILTHQGRSTTVSGLLDTGAAVNVLPYPIGLELGAVWEHASVPVSLTGNLAEYEARALIVSAAVSHFEPVRLVFAWTQATHVPVLLGQVNFFMEFDVCFYRSQLAFDVRPRQKKTQPP